MTLAGIFGWAMVLCGIGVMQTGSRFLMGGSLCNRVLLRSAMIFESVVAQKCYVWRGF